METVSEIYIVTIDDVIQPRHKDSAVDECAEFYNLDEARRRADEIGSGAVVQKLVDEIIESVGGNMASLKRKWEVVASSVVH